MSLHSFERLVCLINPALQQDIKHGASQGGLVDSRLWLYLTLKYLAGGSIHDIHCQVGCEKSTAYLIVKEVCIAICRCKELDFKFPQTVEECQIAADGFTSISFGEAITNTVAAIDGYLLTTLQPPKQLVGNQRQYFSGHYHVFGINIQAGCNHNCKFNYFAMAGPGCMNNNKAVEECMLQSLIDSLPRGFAVIGDAAYTPGPNLNPIYYGINCQNPLHDNFNYFASQLRIRIEMAFGLMQNKWRILERPVPFTKNLKYKVMAIARLHNYCIDTRSDGTGMMETTDKPIEFTRLQPSNERNDDPLLYNDNGEVNRSICPERGHSLLREQMALRIQRLGLQCPINSTLTENEE